MKLNLGCGHNVIDDWINVDYALGARFSKIPYFRSFNKRVKLFNIDWNENIYLHDLTTEFPWADSSVNIIYSSHTLEHFSRRDGLRFLTECFRVLRCGGIIRIVVPDLNYYVTEYLEGRILADDFIEKLGGLYGLSNNKLKKQLSSFIEFLHKCMYDHSRLVEILNDIGFQATRRGAYESDIEEIRLVELDSRTKNAVIVEGYKP